MIASVLCEEEYEVEFEEIEISVDEFEAIDRDKDGKITRSEAYEYFLKEDPHNMPDLDETWEDLDVNRDGVISWDELNEDDEIEEDVKTDFDMIDLNNDGKITREEALEYFRNRDPDDVPNFDELWLDDKNGDGVISWGEFSGPKGDFGDDFKLIEL